MPPLMPPLICRVLPPTAHDGPGNMARDDALLGLVAAQPDAAAFRAYSWTRPTLSLGYFQTVAAVDADPRWQAVDLVRRPTGGGAILHDREWTYALALPADHPLARRHASLYRAVADAVAGALVDLDIPAARRGPAGPQPADPRPFLCFQDRDPADLVLGGAKVLGNAQRRRAGALLQHGSLLLESSPLTPELPGLRDLAPRAPALDSSDLQDHLVPAIMRALGLLPVPAPPDLLPESAIGPLEALYRSPAWTRRR